MKNLLYARCTEFGIEQLIRTFSNFRGTIRGSVEFPTGFCSKLKGTEMNAFVQE
jgi:hypothetical protein